MDPIQTIGAATCLELTVLLMGVALLLDLRNTERNRRLWRSMQSILEAAEPELEPVRQRAA